MKTTLLLWECAGYETQLYLIPTELLRDYEICHNRVIYCDLPPEVLDEKESSLCDRIWHLAMMLGQEPYYGAELPKLADYLTVERLRRQMPRPDAETAGVDTINPPKRAEAPLARYRVHGTRDVPACRLLATGIM